jgi:hypothetical protein
MAETSKQTAKKSPVRKSPAKKASAKKRPVRKSTAKKSSSSEETAEKSAEASSDQETGSRRAAATTESRPQGHHSSSDGARRKTSPMRVAAVALEQLSALTGRPSEGVVGIERDDDEWVVEIEVLELRRIPNTTDVLARYRVTADDSGDVTGYHRLQRYTRGSAGEE